MSSNLLINEPPLQALPTLACLIGLGRAILLQQLHFLSERSLYARRGSDGVMRRWVGLTIDQWRDPNKGRFAFWSKRTLERHFERLVEDGLIRQEKFGKERGNMTNYYAIDYDHLVKLSECISSKCRNDFVKMSESCISSKCRNGHFVKMSECTSSLDNVVDKEDKQQHAREADLFSPEPSPDVVVARSDKAVPEGCEEAYVLLVTHHVTEDIALYLARRYTVEQIRRQVAHFDYLASQGDRPRTPGGKLRRMITDNDGKGWKLPPGAEAAYRRRFHVRPDTPREMPADFPSRWNTLSSERHHQLIEQALVQVQRDDPAEAALLEAVPRDARLLERLRPILSKLLEDSYADN